MVYIYQLKVAATSMRLYNACMLNLCVHLKMNKLISIFCILISPLVLLAYMFKWVVAKLWRYIYFTAPLPLSVAISHVLGIVSR